MTGTPTTPKTDRFGLPRKAETSATDTPEVASALCICSAVSGSDAVCASATRSVGSCGPQHHPRDLPVRLLYHPLLHLLRQRDHLGPGKRRRRSRRSAPLSPSAHGHLPNQAHLQRCPVLTWRVVLQGFAMQPMGQQQPMSLGAFAQPVVPQYTPEPPPAYSQPAGAAGQAFIPEARAVK
eukprot:1803061-Rhodomonas_salina.2